MDKSSRTRDAILISNLKKKQDMMAALNRDAALQPGDLSRMERNERDLRARQAATRNEAANRILRAKRDFSETSFQVGKQVGEFARVGMSMQPSFTPEQEALKQMFGGGDKFWGFPESKVVNINNDLNPSMRGDDSTADLFGFGSRGERSGLF